VAAAAAEGAEGAEGEEGGDGEGEKKKGGTKGFAL